MYMAGTKTDKSQDITQALDYQSAIEQVTNSAIYLVDAKCRIVSWNRGAEAITGYSAAEVIGQPFLKFYLEQDQSAGKPMEILHQAAAPRLCRRGGLARPQRRHRVLGPHRHDGPLQ